jgi:hypothetical protein
MCNTLADDSVIAIATSSGDLFVYAISDMSRLHHIANVTALLMPHELMSCPDFMGHIIISITSAYAPAASSSSTSSSSSEALSPPHHLLLLGLFCGIVVVVDAGDVQLIYLSCSTRHLLRSHRSVHWQGVRPAQPFASCLGPCG